VKLKLGVRYGDVCCNPSIQEAEAGGVQVPSQPGLQSEALSQKKLKKER
jgi:hypothetical protein